MIKWAGYLTVVLSIGHMVSALALTAADHTRAWFSGEIWGEHLDRMSPANGAYWLTFGSFGIPLTLLGLIVLWLDRRDITPPAFIGWTVGAWSLLGAVIFEPAPWPVGIVIAGLLVIGAHRARTERVPA